MRRLLLLVLLIGLPFAVGCKEDKTIAPKEVPPHPKGPPTGAKAGGGGEQPPKNSAPQISP